MVLLPYIVGYYDYINIMDKLRKYIQRKINFFIKNKRRV